MSEDILLVDRVDMICTLTLNRPEKRNSLSPSLLFRLADTLNELNENDDVRCVVIKGAGDKAFSSGYDISEIPNTPEGRERLQKTNPLQTGLKAVTDYKYPVIAMINGFAMGAGCELAVTCDIRIASDKSVLAMPPAKLGVLYSASGMQRFINLVGVGNTKEIFFTGGRIKADRALGMGLINRMVPEAELETVAYEMAAEIAGNAPLSVINTKKGIELILEHQAMSPDGQALYQAMVDQCFSSQDLKEGQKAFLEKRKPKFVGR
jgi:enoyl-CoA hydratase/carnithine racemase